MPTLPNPVPGHRLLIAEFSMQASEYLLFGPRRPVRPGDRAWRNQLSGVGSVIREGDRDVLWIDHRPMCRRSAIGGHVDCERVSRAADLRTRAAARSPGTRKLENGGDVACQDRPVDVIIGIAATTGGRVSSRMVIRPAKMTTLTGSGVELRAGVGVYRGSDCTIAIGKDQLARVGDHPTG